MISYAYKKDTPGERHGSQAERLIAAANPAKFKPNTLFSAGSGDSIVQISAPAARYVHHLYRRNVVIISLWFYNMLHCIAPTLILFCFIIILFYSLL